LSFVERKRAKTVERELKARVWCIGASRTEYYAARSEEELREFYAEMAGRKRAEEDFAAYFEEVPESQLNTEIELNEDGMTIKTTWLKLVDLHESIPALIHTECG
jgi:hypothetical protein